MSPTPSWKIRPHADHCRLTGAPFAEGEVFYSCLNESSEADGFQREDYCEEAWRKVRSGKQPFSFWRSVYTPKPATARPHAVPSDDVESLLQRLMDEGDSSTENVRFLLAVSMERQRILCQVGRERRDGRSLLIYEHQVTGEILIITDPEIQLHQVAEVEQDVRRWLEPPGS